jgi:hypothetical protein
MAKLDVKTEDMEPITVNLPRATIDDLAEFVELTIYPNRSEAIRNILKNGIVREYDHIGLRNEKSKYHQFLMRFLGNLKRGTRFKLNRVVKEYLLELGYKGTGIRTIKDTDYKKIQMRFIGLLKGLVKSHYIEKIKGDSHQIYYEVLEGG